MKRIINFLKFDAWIMLLDIFAFNLSYLIALYFRFNISGRFILDVDYYLEYFWSITPFYTIAALFVFIAFRLYGGMWQYAGLHDMNRVLCANVVTAGLQVVISYVVISSIPGSEQEALRMPISYYILGGFFQLFITGVIRFINRIFQEEKQRLQRKDSVPVMLVGTGETARIVRRQIEDDPNSAIRIACIFAYMGTGTAVMLDGIPIVRDLESVKKHLEKYKVQRVILADSLMPMNVRETIRTACEDTKTDIQDFSGYLRYDNSELSFQRLMGCISGSVNVMEDGKVSHFENGEQALMSIYGKHDVKSISIQGDSFFVELISYKVQPLIVFFITNRPDVALVAEKYGVDRIWIDLEKRGKEERQRNLNTVKSNHTIADIAAIKPLLTRAELMVRVNSWYADSKKEIDDVIAAGADIIMLPYWKTVDEVKAFLQAVHGRCKTSLLLETKEAVNCIDQVLANGGFDEIHIGLNDLHLSYGMSFMFEPLANGIIEMLCNKFKQAGVPYGFGGIARLGTGTLPAERIIMEHYRLGSTRAILSRSFCDCSKIDNIEEIETVFRENMEKLREYEISMANTTQEEFVRNKVAIAKTVEEVAERIRIARSNGM